MISSKLDAADYFEQHRALNRAVAVFLGDYGDVIPGVAKYLTDRKGSDPSLEIMPREDLLREIEEE